MTNIKEGISVAEKLNPDLIIVEGSGASVPDVEADATICVIGAGQSWEGIIGYLGIYRLLSADLIIITMCEEPLADRNKVIFLENEIKKINSKAKIIKTVFRPQPLSDIVGKKIFIAMTANKIIEPIIKNYVESNFNCNVKQMSFSLSNREKLKKDLEKNRDYDTILTELKAASVDVLTDYAFKHKKEIIYMNNTPIILGGKGVLEKELKKIFSKEKD